MKSSAFICLAFLVFQANGDVSQCSPDIIGKIETFWTLIGGPPTNVLKDLEALGRGALFATTYNDHITSKNLTGPECVYADITTTDVTFSVVTGDDNNIQTSKSSLTEKDGVIFLKDQARKLYVFFNKVGTLAYYTCSDSGKEGPAEGGVAIALSKFSPETKKFAELAEDLLYAIDVDLDMEFTDDCFAK